MNILRYTCNSAADEIPAIGFDDDSDWWVGVQKCAATVALAATLAVSAFSAQTAQAAANQHQDDPAGSLRSFVPDEDYNLRNLYSPHLRVYSSQQDGIQIVQFDEDYWQNPSPPSFPPNYVQLPFAELDDAPVGHLFGALDEDVWKNPTAPVPVVQSVQLPLGDQDDVPAGSLALVTEEEYWRNPNPYPYVSVWQAPLIADTDEIVQFSAVVPEEDSWQHSVKIPLHKVYGRTVGGQTQLHIDEDIWQPSMELGSPWQVSLWLDDTQSIPITPFNLDEDFWETVQTVSSPWQWSLWLDSEDLTVFVAPPSPLPFDEEVWFSWVSPVPGYNIVPTFADDSDWVPFVATVPLPFDEETWQQSVELGPTNKITLWTDDTQTVPIPAIPGDEEVIGISQTFDNPWIISLWADDDTPASFSGLVTEDDVWQNPVLPAQWTFRPLYAPDLDDIAVTFEGIQDEDFWQNPVPPVASAEYTRLPYLPDAEEIPALSGQPDEDFWINPVASVPWTFGQMYAPDLDDIPAGSFKGQPDEDFWINPVPSVTYYPPFSSYIFPLLHRDLEEIPSGSLRGLIDEEPTEVIQHLDSSWVWTLWWDDEIPSKFNVVPEEDFWQNPVLPIASYPVPLLFTDDGNTVPPVTIKIDELYWQNPVAPVAAANYLRFPILPDPEEIPAGNLHPPAPAPIIRPCPCQNIINVPSDQLFDIVLCPVTGGIYLACIATQPNTLLAERMGGPTIMIYVYGSPQQAMGQARAFVLHNLGVQ